MADKVNELLLTLGVAIIEYDGCENKIDEYYNKKKLCADAIHFKRMSGPTRHIIIIQNPYICAFTMRHIQYLISQNNSKIVVSKYVDVDKLTDLFSLNPINRKKEMIEQVSKYLCVDTLGVVAIYIDGR